MKRQDSCEPVVQNKTNSHEKFFFTFFLTEMVTMLFANRFYCISVSIFNQKKKNEYIQC
jgi:hypothetical protein